MNLYTRWCKKSLRTLGVTMLIQAGIPRPRFDVHEKPEHIYIHTLARVGVSSGSVFFNGTTDPEHGVRQGRELDPLQTYAIEGEEGFQGCEYVLPFWELFKRKEVRQELLATTGASGYGNIKLVPFTTGGFLVNVQSAFRASPTHYEEHVLSFQILMAVSGGGVLRLADCPFDLANPTFNPYAPHPRALKNLETQQALNRTHQLRSSDIEDRKAARIRAAEQSMANEGNVLSPGPLRALPPKESD